jgi:hypothetical protein
MTRFVHFLGGDYGEQIAEYVLQGLHQQPALALSVPVSGRNFLGLRRKKWQKEIWIIQEKIRKIEKLQEGFLPQTQPDWSLPGMATHRAKGDWQKFLENFKLHPTPGNPRQVKQIQFRLEFADGSGTIALGDARVFQNILGLVDGASV